MSEYPPAEDELPSGQPPRALFEFDGSVRLALDPETQDLTTRVLSAAIDFEGEFASGEAGTYGGLEVVLKAYLDTVYRPSIREVLLSQQQAQLLTRYLLNYAAIRILPIELGAFDEESEQAQQQLTEAREAVALAVELLDPPYNTADIYEANGIEQPTVEVVDNTIEQILTEHDERLAQQEPTTDTAPLRFQPPSQVPLSMHAALSKLVNEWRQGQNQGPRQSERYFFGDRENRSPFSSGPPIDRNAPLVFPVEKCRQLIEQLRNSQRSTDPTQSE